MRAARGIRVADVRSTDRIVGQIDEDDVVPRRMDGVVGAPDLLVRDDRTAREGPARRIRTR
jgi:hypothetical protein